MCFASTSDVLKDVFKIGGNRFVWLNKAAVTIQFGATLTKVAGIALGTMLTLATHNMKQSPVVTTVITTPTDTATSVVYFQPKQSKDDLYLDVIPRFQALDVLSSWCIDPTLGTTGAAGTGVTIVGGVNLVAGAAILAGAVALL